MKYFFKLCISFALLAAQLGCESAIEDLKSGTTTSSVAVSESDGIVTGLVNPAQDAKIAASQGGALADSSVYIPSGSLQIDAASVNIEVGPAVDQTADIATAIGFSSQAIGDGTAALFVGGADGPIGLKAGQTLQISMPLPIKNDALSLHSGGHLALLYVYYTGTGYKAGLKVLDPEADLRGIFIETSVPGLGFYRIVYLGVHVESKEIEVNFTPSVQRSVLK